MTADEFDLLRKARDSVKAAKIMLSGGMAGFAASRAYYAMFHAAQALLEHDGIAFSKRSAVIAAFGKHLG